jgi:hypothetical protein
LLKSSGNGLEISDSGGASIVVDNASGFAAVNATNGPPSHHLYPNGHIVTQGTAPRITSGFGTSPSITGQDPAGRVTVGSGGTATTGVVTFNTSWPDAPTCVANDETTTDAIRATATTTTLTLTSATAWGAADKLVWVCLGY